MQKTQIILITMLIVLLAACNTAPTPEAAPATATAVPTNTPVPDLPEPTATPIVYLAYVNGEGISESSFLASLAQFEQAQAETGTLLAPGEDAATRVMDDLISRMLLSQAARLGGFTADSAMIEERFGQLAEQAGGIEALTAWIIENGYTEDSFREALKLEIEAAWQREQIFNTVPRQAFHIEARQILFHDAYQAERAYGQLENGTSMEIILANNDPQNSGYLGWFPRGYLLLPELEEVFFSLEPGQYSPVIETEIGHHILYVIAQDPERSLTADALWVYQTKALHDWLASQRIESQIDFSTP